MGTKTTSGFTIVEVMLVLAISGLMLVGIFAAAAANIRQNEYRDSVYFLQNELKDQFAQAQNPANDRPKNRAKCFQGGDVSRGTSKNCLIVGRLVLGDGDEITSVPLLGMTSLSAPANGEENPQLADINNQAGATDNANGWWVLRDNEAATTTKMRWGSTIGAMVGSEKTDQFSVAIIMSPKDGSIRSYADNTLATSDAALYQLLRTTRQLDVCVENDGMFAARPLAVRVVAGASSGSGVVVPPEVDSPC